MCCLSLLLGSLHLRPALTFITHVLPAEYGTAAFNLGRPLMGILLFYLPNSCFQREYRFAVLVGVSRAGCATAVKSSETNGA
jgi:ABC-type transport system involved in cytochrome c biogenesis permease subunit